MTKTMFESRHDEISSQDLKIKPSFWPIFSLVNVNSNKFGKNFDVDARQNLAVNFKYQKNCPRGELDEVRRLLELERAKQSEEELAFYAQDYERLMTDDWLLTRFLIRGAKRARQITAAEYTSAEEPSNILIYEKTIELIGLCAKFRYDFQVNGSTSESEFPIEWTSVQGLMSHGNDLVGNPVIYLRVALHKPKLIATDELRQLFKRYLLYILESGDRNLRDEPGKAICCVFDMTGSSIDNIDLELTTWMIRSFKDCSPKLFGYIIIYNPPWFFTTTFKLISGTLLSTNKKQSVKLVSGGEIRNYIDEYNLPEFIKCKL